MVDSEKYQGFKCIFRFVTSFAIYLQVEIRKIQITCIRYMIIVAMINEGYFLLFKLLFGVTWGVTWRVTWGVTLATPPTFPAPPTPPPPLDSSKRSGENIHVNGYGKPNGKVLRGGRRAPNNQFFRFYVPGNRLV